MSASREDLNRYYRQVAISPQFKDIELKYGKYLYLPLDVPRIEATDVAAFVDWYTETAQPIKKLRGDIASGTGSAYALFKSVNSPGFKDSIWATNHSAGLSTHFPEIEAAILEHLPFRMMPEFSLWSSTSTVMPHRDQGPWRDCPFSFRIMLYDENPSETLYVRECVPGQWPSANFRLKRLEATNTFAWNNLRTEHGSMYWPGHRKILMILHFPAINVKRLEQLYERSVEKYGEFAMTSNYVLEDFIKVTP